MSHYDYEVSKQLMLGAPPFAALIMAAFRKADTGNTAKLATAFPELYTEIRDRYNAPGGHLPGDSSSRRYRDTSVSEEHVTAAEARWQQFLDENPGMAEFVAGKLDFSDIYEAAYSIDWPDEWDDEQIIFGIVSLSIERST